LVVTGFEIYGTLYTKEGIEDDGDGTDDSDELSTSQ